MRRSAAFVALLIVGCSSSSVAHIQASPSTPASPTAPTSALASPSASPTSNPAVAKVAFSCRLPVVTYTTGGDGITYQGGFITFPAGTYADDPRGQINGRYILGNFVTKQTPILDGALDSTSTPFYDVAVNRWVPSSAADASPDGATYAYAAVGASSARDAEIFVVNAATGTYKTFQFNVPAVGAANGVEVVDYDGAGVDFVVTQVEQYPIGVWRLDLSTGKVSAMTQVGAVMAVRGGYAWAGAVDPHDPSPPRVPASRTLFDEIARVNLATGAQTPWYYTPGRSQFVLGMASAGWPIVNVSDAPDYPPYGGEVRLLPEAHTDGESNGELVSSDVAISSPETDGDRTWFGSDNGIFLYTSAGGLQKVFALTPDQASSKTISPAGFCR